MLFRLPARRRMTLALFAAFGLHAHAADTVLDEVRVTATPDGARRYHAERIPSAARIEAHTLDVPVAAHAVPRELMEEQGILRAADAVRNVSGVTRKPAYLGLTDSYRIRGFDAPVGLWNGFRRDHYYSFTDMSHLERVEVIKGAASVNYGFLEPGGVVNYVTKRPEKTPRSSVQLTVGSEGLVRPEFDIGAAFGTQSPVRLRITGAHEKSDSYRDFVDGELSTLGATLEWDLSRDTQLSLSGYLFDSTRTPDRGFANTLGRSILGLPRERFLGEPQDRYDFRQADAAAVLSHRFNPNWSARFGINRYRFEDFRDNFQQSRFGADGRTVSRTYTVVPSTGATLTAFAEATTAFTTGAAKHRLSAGVERIKTDSDYEFYLRNATPLDAYAPVYGADRTRGPLAFSESSGNRSTGIYLQDLVALGEQWKVLAGVRHDRFRNNVADRAAGTSTRFEQSETTPRLGVVYQPTPEWSVYSSVARSFRPQAATRLAGGARPDPERGEQIELGVKHASLDGRHSASAALFGIRKKNVATADPADPTGTFSVLAGEQRSRGIEFDASSRLSAQWNVVASYAYSQAEVTRDNTLPVSDNLVNVPRHQASVWVRHELAALPGVGVGLGAFHVGKREARLPNSFTVPGYSRFDAGVFWKVSPTVDASLHLKNLTGKTYFDSQDNLLYPGAPRALQASVKMAF